MKLIKTCHSALMISILQFLVIKISLKSSTKIYNFTSPKFSKFSSRQTFISSKSTKFSNTREALRSENLDSMLSLIATIALR